ncbi:MAG: ABC transporter ATP-binding protein [Deltaproteobacteria bacterium]|nr:ABC transporter ATP-binding protein [Deltaproteobacteria bacterium]
MIQLENVKKRFGEQEVLRDVSFEVKQGSITTLIGRSGVGKSLLLRHMIGLDQPDTGRIFIDGANIVGMGTAQLNAIRRRFGVLFQDGALFDSMSVRENVAFPLREHTRLGEKAILDMVAKKLDVVGLGSHANKFPAELSGGMRKRVGLARALALDPDLVFFDEPTSGLDPITRGAIYRLIEGTHVQGEITYFLVSHDISGVMAISDEIMMLHEGKIVTRGTPDDVRTSSDPIVQQFLLGSPDGPIAID